MAAENRYQNICRCTKQLIGDLADESDAEALHYAVQAALTRYSQVFERIVTQVIQLTVAGYFGIPLVNWSGDQLCEIAYLHWPAASSVAGTKTENKILSYYYWFNGTYDGAEKVYTYVDMQIEGSTLPEINDYILVAGVCQHRILGMEYTNYTGGDASTYSTVPKSHEHILSLGAAAYYLRLREVGPQLLLENPDGSGYYSAYHMGVMADMSDRYMRDFEQELYKLYQKRPHRPLWSNVGRARLQRIEGK
jgi:hypothetical protein